METKKVKITLPKGCKATGVNTKVGDGAIIVEYIPEKKYVPKNGDIIFEATKENTKGWIAISKNEEDNHVRDYRSCRISDDYLTIGGEYLLKSDITELRPATETEKKYLFGVMEKQGLRWNDEAKKVEKDKWVPKHGETYYYISGERVLGTTNNDWDVDKTRISVDNCFPTDEKAQECWEKIKEVFKNR